MKIDFKLLHKIFFWNVIFIILWIAGDIIFTESTKFSTILIPFILTPIHYILEKKYNLYGFDD